MAKGWTQNDAEHAARGWRLQYTRWSAMTLAVKFDVQWNEWVVVVTEPNGVATIQRKPRKGVRCSYRTAEQQGASV